MTIRIALYDDKEDVKNCHFLTGFHGVGLTGYITVNHIVKSLHAHPIGYVETQHQPALVSLAEERISFPFEIFRHDDIVILFPRVQPKRSEVREFTREMVKWVTENEMKDAVLIGGLDNRFKQENATMRCVPTRPSLDRAKTLNIPLLEEALFVTGPLALMLTYFEMKTFPAIALLPYSERGRPDPRAAALAVKEINSLFSLNVDDLELINDAKRIEDEVTKIINGQKEKAGDDSQTMYT
ncbi:MAG: PAC2 family protein [Promethearchaeati archaeon SRVP18_Atabeyarchaeia-1]